MDCLFRVNTKNWRYGVVSQSYVGLLLLKLWLAGATRSACPEKVQQSIRRCFAHSLLETGLGIVLELFEDSLQVLGWMLDHFPYVPLHHDSIHNPTKDWVRWHDIPLPKSNECHPPPSRRDSPLSSSLLRVCRKSLAKLCDRFLPILRPFHPIPFFCP